MSVKRGSGRRRLDVDEVVGVLEELQRRANGALRIHQLNSSAKRQASLTYYHLGRHDGLKDSAALLAALIDWVEDVAQAGHFRPNGG